MKLESRRPEAAVNIILEQQSETDIWTFRHHLQNKNIIFPAYKFPL